MAWALVPAIAAIVLVLGALTIRFDDGWDQEPADCHEHMELLITGPAAGPITLSSNRHQLAATGCGGVVFGGRTYPNVLPIRAMDWASLERAGSARHTNAGNQWELAAEQAYRVPGVPDDQAVIVVLRGTPNGPAIAWRSPFPASACALLALRSSDRRPSACI